MNFDSQICTTCEQSERLISSGLKKETADMCWNKLTLHGTPVTYPSQDVWSEHSIVSDSHYPAWSLNRLIVMVPRRIANLKEGWDICGHDIVFGLTEELDVCYEEPFEEEPCYNKYFREGNLFNKVVDCIEWLIKEGHFNNEYLER